MKKIFLLTILLFQLTFVFGQNAQWDNWQAVSCYKGFQTASISYGFNKFGNGYEWNWKVKSNYNKKVSFNLAVTIGNDKKDWGRFTLSPGDEHKHVSFYYNNASPNIKIEITKVCFSDNYLDNCWAECDNGTPNQPNCDKKTSSSTSNSSSNTTTTQQNDLTEYNRSKADLERQMAKKNAEGQQKSQNYITAMNAGIAAHNSGNYTEAKRQFSIALNNCNTDEARRKAQEYYNKSVDAEKSQSKINAVGELVAPTINSVSEISKAIRDSKNQKREIDDRRLKNDMKDDNFFKVFIADVISTFKQVGEEHISIDILNSDEKSIRQSIHYKDFSINALFFRDDFPPAGIKSLTFLCKNKEVWERIKNYKIYKKLQKPTYRVENEEYSSYMVMIVDYDKKNIKNYEYLSNTYNIYVGRENNLESVHQENNVVKNEDLNLNEKELYLKGVDFYKQKDFINAYKYYDFAIKKGSTNSMVSIGCLYYNGEGVLQDYEKAKQWYLEAVNKNNTDGMLYLGYMYSENEGYPPDSDEAIKWFSRAAESGNKQGLFEIGDIYYQGDIVKEDYIKAFEFFFKASNYNNISAIMKIALMYEKGIGVEKNSAKAKEWYTKSCELGITFDCDKIKN